MRYSAYLGAFRWRQLLWTTLPDQLHNYYRQCSLALYFSELYQTIPTASAQKDSPLQLLMGSNGNNSVRLLFQMQHKWCQSPHRLLQLPIVCS
ncbi:hypothetical protein VCRA2113O213_360002 [Vibrio crassostreae]|nr:hypothetical protein VCRA2113O213_360002 [Vibrio crassostreae]